MANVIIVGMQWGDEGKGKIVDLLCPAFDGVVRYEYVAEIMKRIKVDSFGALHRNQQARIEPGPAACRALYSTYKFTLAFENSIAPDYVTEKYFDPLLAGSVPVYRGSPTVHEFAPGRHSYIDVNDFASPRELCMYLNHLDSHDDEYLAYHAWRSEPLLPSFVGLVDRVREGEFRRLAKRVAAIVASRS
jgi:hypothetical protein